MHITAAPEDVFTYFTDPARYVQWMGSEANLEPEPGGTYRVHMSDGFKAAGTFLQVKPPHLVVFTWGFADQLNGRAASGQVVQWLQERSRRVDQCSD